MRAVMLSYNLIFLPVLNDWKRQGDNEVLLLQGVDLSRWTVPTFAGKTGKEGVEVVKSEIERLWSKLEEAIPTVDLFVFYVGSSGAERVINLAKEYGLTPERTLFVLCDCDLRFKIEVITSCGFNLARRVLANCGGQRELLAIYESLLSNGCLPS